MTPKSHTLFHFTRSIDALQSILKNGFNPNYCLEDSRWYYENTSYVAVLMCCFCDIPISRISNHITAYGSYGIGLSREWAIRNKLNPVIYVSEESNLYNSIMNIAFLDDDIDSEIKKKRFTRRLRMLRAHIKPLEGKMKIDGKDLDVKFYQESEWRYVPNIKNVSCIISKKNFENNSYIEDLLQKIKPYSIKFELDDIKYIFVKNDSEIPGIVSAIRSIYNKSNPKFVDTLTTRILSVETVVRDL